MAWRAGSWDHPRIRGEHARTGTTTPRRSGSSPHTRGARPRRRVWTILDGIIPAYAGSTWIIVTRQAPARDHPRIRGEHATSWGGPESGCGSSPHTRGAHVRTRGMTHDSRIIPAYAGSTAAADWGLDWRTDHPRIRGEHLSFTWCDARTAGSSPHTRGAQISGR